VRHSQSTVALKRILKLMPTLTNDNLNDLIKAMGTEVSIRRVLNQTRVAETGEAQTPTLEQPQPAQESSA
jgi:hypothetical protein